MKNFIKQFMVCGVMGWCIEILFTAFYSFRKRELSLKGNTSVWMFPIYGLAALLGPFGRLLQGRPLWIRGGIYACCIYLVELLCGVFLRKRNLCPWDYSSSRWHIAHVIRLDYLPHWILTGLLFEQILKKDSLFD